MGVENSIVAHQESLNAAVLNLYHLQAVLNAASITVTIISQSKLKRGVEN